MRPPIADLYFAWREEEERRAAVRHAVEVLNVMHAEREAKHKEWEASPEGQEAARRKAEEKAYAEELHRLRYEKHPYADNWRALPAEELRRLVWSMPTKDVAALFGVSDVTIGKRCKAQGIKKPPVGFWQFVEHGRLPHPRGAEPARVSLYEEEVS